MCTGVKCVRASSYPYMRQGSSASFGGGGDGVGFVSNSTVADPSLLCGCFDHQTTAPAVSNPIAGICQNVFVIGLYRLK
jgi:hypothetical protein